MPAQPGPHTEAPPKLAVTTAGGLGGWVQPGGPFRPAPLPGQVVDTFGAGDSFAAGLTFALARGDAVEDAVALAARCGAAVMTGRGPYAGQLGADALTPEISRKSPFRGGQVGEGGLKWGEVVISPTAPGCF